jgi:hypothetical protein
MSIEHWKESNSSTGASMGMVDDPLDRRSALLIAATSYTGQP